MHQHDSIDRIAPTLEPDQPVLLHQNWHHLAFFHWEVSPADLQALIPPRLTLDTFEGKAFVGLVPFTMTGVRPIGLPPLPWISSFHEINVRRSWDGVYDQWVQKSFESLRALVPARFDKQEMQVGYVDTMR